MKFPKFAKKWKWMAMDRNEDWCLYETKPNCNTVDDGWVSFEVEEGLRKALCIGDAFEPAKDWKKSLIRINK